MTGLKFIGVSVLALIGLLLKGKHLTSIHYRHLWGLSSYAVTIPTIFFAITDFLKIMIPFSFLIYWASAILILYLTIKEIPVPKKTNV